MHVDLPNVRKILNSMLTKLIMNRNETRKIRKSVILEHLEDKSSSGLLMNDRPSGVQQKHEIERKKHIKLYKEIYRSARKVEEEKIKQRVKEIEDSFKEERLIGILKEEWNELLKNWSESELNSKRFKKLLRRGVPTSVRPKLWGLLLKNRLSAAQCIYDSLNKLSEKAYYSKDPNDSTIIASIQMDLNRTFAYLKLFSNDGAMNYDLFILLYAFTIYNSETGYVQGMGYVGGILLLALKPYEAFNAFNNIANTSLFTMLYKMDESQINTFYMWFEEILMDLYPYMLEHMAEIELTPNLYIIELLHTLFSGVFELEIVLYIMDQYMVYGPIVFIKTILLLLEHHSNSIKMTQDAVECAIKIKRKLKMSLKKFSELYYYVANIDVYYEKLKKKLLVRK